MLLNARIRICLPGEYNACERGIISYAAVVHIPNSARNRGRNESTRPQTPNSSGFQCPDHWDMNESAQRRAQDAFFGPRGSLVVSRGLGSRTPRASQGTGRWVPEVLPGSKSGHLGDLGYAGPHVPGAWGPVSNSQQSHTLIQGFQFVDILCVHLQVSRGPEKWSIHATQRIYFIAVHLHFDLMWYHRSPISLIYFRHHGYGSLPPRRRFPVQEPIDTDAVVLFFSVMWVPWVLSTSRTARHPIKQVSPVGGLLLSQLARWNTLSQSPFIHLLGSGGRPPWPGLWNAHGGVYWQGLHRRLAGIHQR